MRISDWSSDVCSSDLAVSTGSARVITDAGDRVEALIRLDPETPVFLYVSRKVDPLVLAQVARTQTALSDYKTLVTRSRALELRFNIILLVVSLLILAISIWVALWLARSEEHTSELQSLMRISYAVFCLKKKHTL